MYEIKSVNRALKILDLFSLECPEVGVSEAARKLNMDKVTVARVMYTLEQRNVLVQSSDNRKYRLGGKILELARIVLSKQDLRKIASPYLMELHAKTNETVHIFIRAGDKRICLDRIESSQQVRLVLQVGDLFPLHGGAAGKVLLSGLADEEIEEIIKRTGLPRYTPNTITTMKQLEEEIERIRKEGFAISCEEVVNSSHQVAAPVRDSTGKVIAAVGVSWPFSRTTPERWEEFSALIKRAAAQISQEAGFRTR